MSFSYDQIKKDIQGFFSEGVLTIVGSGLSCAEGIPGMGGLAKELLNEVPKFITENSKPIWDKIEASLNQNVGLEDILLKYQPDEDIEKAIQKVTSAFIRDHESRVIKEVIEDGKILRFSKLIKSLYIPNGGLPIITTNYDRLIEISCELFGIQVDNMFFGKNISKLDEYNSRMSFCKNVSPAKNRSVKLEYHKRIKIFKPHGCLSWFMFNGKPISTSYNINSNNLIITPGLNKFRAGYEQPFDIHREKANNAIDYANKFLIIGYGFNDDHLETHLIGRIKKGVPTLIITRSLSQNAMKLLGSYDNVMAVSFAEKNGQVGTLYVNKGKQTFLNNENIWDLGILVEEVLEA